MDTTLVKALRDALQRETGARVELVETHISWVLLTATLAYKLKKPVRFPFVDFASIAARKHFCEEELRLNRRFAPSLYLDVMPVCGAREAPRLGGEGVPIDHVVRMRRFPESSLLRNLLAAGRLEPAWLDGFAQRLAALQGAAERVVPPSAFGAPDAIVRAAVDVLSQLLVQRSDSRLATLSAWIRERAQALHMAWIARQQGGAVRECHGDLHMANVVLVDGELTAFDCIEFDPMMRRIDVMSDVAFLTMDLKAHGRADLAFRFLDAWLQHSGDHAGLQVLGFYEVYRALVRAMAAGLGPQAASKPDYLACAAQLAHSPRGRARLLITHGFSGSGKSTIASQLLCAAGAVRIRSDVERKRLFGLDPLARSAERGLAIYGAEATRRTFERLRACARDALLAGYPVIVDAAFLRSAERRSFQVLAAELDLPFAILDCRAAEAVLRRRVAERGAAGTDASEASLEVLARQLAAHEALEADERALAIEVFTEDAVDIASLEARWRTQA
ncbi:putative ATPase [Variovorax paradoxus B4]|uniref:Putative ATPase n=1 Tax=Variovorax paradoxus B4 TaxID=1246301 RepID=T1XL17_VARPD|nr:bifunctional aminoglycoside phosphotransferase/ATP-binding protein [Variovorax paradoxus]AGU52994.1 putative ATPase [Variovorax paradoxus B4]